jgi:selenocysteine-specific elongation factor
VSHTGGVPSKQKYHVIVGHDTVMAEATFFGLPDGQGMTQAGAQSNLMPSNTLLSFQQAKVNSHL